MGILRHHYRGTHLVVVHFLYVNWKARGAVIGSKCHSGSSASVRIMSYNVHRCLGIDRMTSPERVAEIIATCQPDVVALQEVDVGRMRSGLIDQAETIASALGMNLQFFPTVRILDELYGDAILSRLPARLVKADQLPMQGMREPRGALWASIQVGTFELQVINTHLGLRGQERLQQIEALLGSEWISHPECREPCVLVGDFNAPPRSRSYRRLASRLSDAFAMSNRRPEPTFPTRYPVLRLDHIFVSPSIEVLHVQTVRTALARFASDHFPLIAELKLVGSVQGRSGSSIHHL
jgi:endonuclease/exonuclease/phosphatase family metal-dependent hydrolase